MISVGGIKGCCGWYDVERVCFEGGGVQAFQGQGGRRSEAADQ